MKNKHQDSRLEVSLMNLIKISLSQIEEEEKVSYFQLKPCRQFTSKITLHVIQLLARHMHVAPPWSLGLGKERIHPSNLL